MFRSPLSFINGAVLTVILTACGAGSGSEGNSPEAGVSSNLISMSSEPSAASENTYEQTSFIDEEVQPIDETPAIATDSTQAKTTAGAIRIEAENYTSMYGVKNEGTTDVGGGKNVGYIETGDWMAYNNINFNVSIKGRYKVTYRVASLSGGGRVALKNLNSERTLNSVDIPKTNDWQKWVDVTQEITLNVGNYNFKIAAELGGFNINWFALEPIPDTTPPAQPTAAFDAQGKIISGVAEAGSLVTVKNASNSLTLGTVTADATTGAYSVVLATALTNKEFVTVTAADASGNISIATTIVAPQIATSIVIQAENFTSMSGVQNERCSDVGGGKNVGYIETGDWMAYNNINFNVPVEGRYKVTYRVASLSGGGRLALKNLSGGLTVNSVNVPKTNDWQKWVDVTQEITLKPGNHNFRIVAEVGGFNINWFKLEMAGSGSSASSAPTIVTPPSSSSRSSSIVSSSQSSLPRSSSSSSLRSSSLSSSSRISSVSSSVSSIASSKPSSISSSSSSRSSSSSVTAKTVTVEWSHPYERENGDYLELDEIGGYEIRIYDSKASGYSSVKIPGNSTTSYRLNNYLTTMRLEIAVYDTHGVYSQFVPVSN